MWFYSHILNLDGAAEYYGYSARSVSLCVVGMFDDCILYGSWRVSPCVSAVGVSIVTTWQIFGHFRDRPTCC